MINIGIDKLKGTTTSIYKLANLASRRAQELSEGAGKLVEAKLTDKFTTIALKEIVENMISYKEAPKAKE